MANLHTSPVTNHEPCVWLSMGKAKTSAASAAVQKVGPEAELTKSLREPKSWVSILAICDCVRGGPGF